ncbi:methyl-accepting chemotaxis protein [Plastorhodobacter daqingensis]|uniref:Methyl-accepting chemotaxis protein n=1 Tax=Plastorhodobacter daqingensis TaxID=1387281 RepID=A0ABW2UL26_9RHOB
MKRLATSVSLAQKLVAMISVLILLVAGALTMILERTQRDQLLDKTLEIQQMSLRVLATMMSQNLDGLSFRITPDGSLADVIWEELPEFASHELIDLVGQNTGTTATLFGWDSAQGEFVRLTTNIKAADGSRAVGTVLGKNGAVHPVMLRGETFRGQATILGTDYITIYEPIMNPAGEVRGIFYVGVSRASVDAALRESFIAATALSLVFVVLASALAWFAVKHLTSPLRALGSAITSIAAKRYDTDVPATDHPDEIGAIARNLERFRDQLAEADRLAQHASTRQHEQERVVRDLTAALERLARGDLTGRIESHPSDPFPADYEQLRATFNALAESLNDMVTSITESAQGVRSGAGEIAQVAQDLSSRAETQAATLEQSAAALNQLTESVRATAGKASQADRATTENRGQAEVGRSVVREAVSAMRQIEKSSEQITRIIGVIDDISFQTNLLALNAGVEAARAGEAGRGFAVVASEVRALAQRASGSAKEIKALISESSQQVAEGSALVSRTGESLEDILGRVSEVSALVSEIAAAATEQAKGLAEINTGINQIDVVTQQNAAVAEESTAAASSLMSEAEQLTQALSGFRTMGSARATPRSATATAPRPRPPEPDRPSAPRRAKAAGGGGGWEEF